MIRKIDNLKISDIDNYVGNQRVIDMLHEEIERQHNIIMTTKSAILTGLAEVKIQKFEKILKMVSE